jgi:UDP-2-acetamido-3-amino-2,3-dideoxy-glucuronate N-acetyltransferase
MRNPKVGVVGAGYWGKNLVRVFNKIGSLSAICDSSISMLNSMKLMYPAVKTYQKFPDLLNDPKISAIIIATPPASHFNMAREALMSGKDVFVEKPLSLTTSEGEELVRIADKKSKIIMVGHILRYHPAITALKALISSGKIGKVHYIYSTRLNLGKIRREENILWSFAPHDISVILYLLGESPNKIWAQGGNYLHPNIADVTMTILGFPSGVKSHIFVSWLHPYKEQKLVVVGDKKWLFLTMLPRKTSSCSTPIELSG